MARELRPRKARPSYAATFEAGSENEAILNIDDGASSDEFQLGDNKEEAEDDAREIDYVAESTQLSMNTSGDGNKDSMLVESRASKPKKASERSKKQPTSASSTPRQPLTQKSVLSRPVNRQQYALPMPAPDHRHRASPLYWRTARVERLIQSPKPFGPSVTIPTNNWTYSKLVMDRYNKASGHNVGHGPIWEFMEDRSWWKESNPVEDGKLETEATRRPKIHETVEVGDIVIIDGQEAKKYLPMNGSSLESPNSSSVNCYFGLPGKDVKRELRTFDSVKISEHINGSKAHVFYAGGPVWGIDWCPIYVEDHPYRSYKQYIAVAPLPSDSHSPDIGVKCIVPSPACVQIWSFSPEVQTAAHGSTKGKEKAVEESWDIGVTKCEMVICIDCGPAQEIKWCPLPSNDSWVSKRETGIRKLGVLAGAFEDGSMSVFVIPDPDDLQPQETESPIYVKVNPVVRIELEETSTWTIDWANSERLAVGCTNGSIAVYDIKDALARGSLQVDLLPTHYLSVHQSAIRSVQWVQVPRVSPDGCLKFTEDPCMITSGGYDGCEILTDLRDGCGNIVNRTRDVAAAITYSRYSTGVISIDLENIVKTFTLSPSMLGRGHHLVEAGGPIWSLHTSDYHSQLAVGSADGSVLSTNILKSTRRSAATPFLYYKIFQLDYSRKTREFRMLEQFLPQEIPDRSSTGRKASKQSADSSAPAFGTGAWSPEISVTRVVWNNGGGLARAPLLASATASGLCRIDWLLGQLQRDRVPYGGVEYIRGEIDSGKMEEDDEEEVDT